LANEENARAATKNKNVTATPTPILAYVPPDRLCECFVGVAFGIEVAVVKLDIEEEDFVVLTEATFVFCK
jgi:hypothetical protein